MGLSMVDTKQIIMSFTRPPSLGDVEVIVESVRDMLPDELIEYCDDIEVVVEDFPDETLLGDLDVENEYDLMAILKKGNEISPGVESKNPGDVDTLVIFRRPLLDMWCESGEDLTSLIRHVMIEEVGRSYDFSESEIDEMIERHYQGLL